MSDKTCKACVYFFSHGGEILCLSPDQFMIIVTLDYACDYYMPSKSVCETPDESHQ